MTRDRIMDAVEKHHRLVKKDFDGEVLMTSLFGSQNYMLDDDQSDIDTCSFVLPRLRDIARLEDPAAYEFDAGDGKCVVKDLRSGINLLKKTNPNSIEWFASRYVVFHPGYELLFNTFLSYEEIYHADEHTMLNACAGMAKQLSKRNMSAGKCYAHALRIRDMWGNYRYKDNFILDFRSGKARDEAMKAKRDLSGENDTYYNERIQEIDNFFRLEKAIGLHEEESYANKAFNRIDSFQREIFACHVFSESLFPHEK